MTREEAIKVLEMFLHKQCSLERTRFAYDPDTVWDAVKMAFDALEQPEQKTGKWIRTGRENVYGGFEVQCSECGSTVMIWDIEDELFCRHCGAKMGEQG